jgi:ethanolamine utilization protein EutA
MRDTVLGASAHTVTLSGSTIWAERDLLPLRNVPVVRPAISGDHSGSPPQAGDVAGAVAEAVRRWGVDPLTGLFAVALEMSGALDYNRLLVLAGGLAKFASTLPAGRPLIVVTERDYAQALGQTVKGLAPDRPLVVIDQVGLDEGDYIDIGAPLMDGRVVPLSVKTLVFYH